MGREIDPLAKGLDTGHVINLLAEIDLAKLHLAFFSEDHGIDPVGKNMPGLFFLRPLSNDQHGIKAIDFADNVKELAGTKKIRNLLFNSLSYLFPIFNPISFDVFLSRFFIYFVSIKETIFNDACVRRQNRLI